MPQVEVINESDGDLCALGLLLESVVQPPQCHLRHKIARLDPPLEGEGLAGEHHHRVMKAGNDVPQIHSHVLRVGDEVLQVNERVLAGLSHTEAMEVVQTTPPPMTIVVSRPLVKGEGPGMVKDAGRGATDQIPSASSLENHAPSGHSNLKPLPADIDFLLDDFSRRFERQSWRIRHEEERRRLKQKFEVCMYLLMYHMQKKNQCVSIFSCGTCVQYNNANTIA